MLIALVFALIVGLSSSAPGCHGLEAPHPDTLVRPFAPIGPTAGHWAGFWAGHWGVDVASPLGATVPAIGSGTVTFAGQVVKNTTVTVHHGGGIRTSYSYLERVVVSRGDRVGAGAAVGIAGIHDGTEAYHLSLRRWDTYLDPATLHRCSASPQRGLWLAAPRLTYPLARAWHPRRYIRPSPHGTSRCRGCGR